MVEAAGQEENGISDPPTKTFSTDRIRCINQGLGGSIEHSDKNGGVWSVQEASNHINYLELLTAFLALKAFGKPWTHLTVLLRMDNFTAVTYVNQKGGTCSQSLCQLAISIWEWCQGKNITLCAEHLPGHLNTAVDTESRSVRDRCDWMLNPTVFQRITTQLGPLEVNLFASRLTRQLPRFYSWRPDPEAEATDAFLQDWAKLRGFANPPWCLIHRCLSKVKAELARIVLVVPLWKIQSWFPVLLELLEDYPRVLPHQTDLVVMPSDQGFLMQQGVPTLIACPISGNPSHHKDFLLRLKPHACLMET